VNPINAGLYKHFKYWLVSINITKVVEYASLDNSITVNTAKGIAISVQRGA
jgi:hypothetical protein